MSTVSGFEQPGFRLQVCGLDLPNQAGYLRAVNVVRIEQVQKTFCQVAGQRCGSRLEGVLKYFHWRRVKLWIVGASAKNQQCRGSSAAAGHPSISVKNDKPLVAAAPRGQHDELFPDLPARPAPIQTGFRGSPWEKIHESCEHSNTVWHAAGAA